jgi:MerR family mercuric resistance operon transcriptional regulator
MDTLTIARLAREIGVHVETIRFYHRRGLLPEPARSPGGIRQYGQQDLARVRFIKSAQRMGFTLEEITQLLRLEDGAHCQEAREIALHKLAQVQARLRDLTQVERVLRALVEECATASGRIRCPLIEALHTAPLAPPAPALSPP